MEIDLKQMISEISKLIIIKFLIKDKTSQELLTLIKSQNSKKPKNKYLKMWNAND